MQSIAPASEIHCVPVQSRRCGRRGKKEEKKKCGKQKCNLEAVLRGMTQFSNRLLVRERCFCVALHRTLLMWTDTCLCGRSAELSLWGLGWKMGHFNIEIRPKAWTHMQAQNTPPPSFYSHCRIILLVPRTRILTSVLEKSTQLSVDQPQTVIWFLVCKSCTSRCWINTYVWADQGHCNGITGCKGLWGMKPQCYLLMNIAVGRFGESDERIFHQIKYCSNNIHFKSEHHELQFDKITWIHCRVCLIICFRAVVCLKAKVAL